MSKSFRERFPPPWQVKETQGGFLVLAANGTTLLASVASPGAGARTALPEHYLTPSEAKAMAVAITKLGEK